MHLYYTASLKMRIFNVRDEKINCGEIESLIIFQNIRYALFFIIL